MSDANIHDEVQKHLNGESLFDDTDDEEFEKLLNEFISSEITEEDTETMAQDYKEAHQKQQTTPSQNIDVSLSDIVDNPSTTSTRLCEEEQNLFSAHENFKTAIFQIADKNDIKRPTFKITEDSLYPRYKPYLGEKFAYDSLAGWDVMIKAYPTRIMNINPGAKDEELLEYAEKTTDESLQLAIISYVEILIELESCEIAYEKRRLKAKRKKIEREVIEEHQRRIDRMKKYIQAIEEKQFPINAEKLINNYFKTSRKDADGAFKVLTNNPATFAPIEVSKIKDRFFGMIKAKPEDGIRINRELGNFLKKLKV